MVARGKLRENFENGERKKDKEKKKNEFCWRQIWAVFLYLDI